MSHNFCLFFFDEKCVICFDFLDFYDKIKTMKRKDEFDFKNYIKARKKFISSNKKKSFVILDGEGKIMFSTPHAVKQVRLGREKFAEPNTLALALAVRQKVNVPLISKTACMNDDANFDLLCPYRHELKEYIQEHKIKYLIDIHSLAEKREQDINLGVNFGMNIAPDEAMFDFIHKEFSEKGFKVFVDQPFNGGARTIASFISKECKIWTMQLEINCKFLLKPENVEWLMKIISVLVDTFERANSETLEKPKKQTTKKKTSEEKGK